MMCGPGPEIFLMMEEEQELKEKILNILSVYGDLKSNLSSGALREQLTNEILGVINET